MIPEISVDFFLEKILPPLPSSLIDKIDSVLKSLESQDAINVKQNRWTAFSVDPAVTAGHSNVYGREPVVFQPLATIFEQVVAAAKQIDGALQQTFGLFVTGTTPIYSDRGAGDSRPDGFNRLLVSPESKNDCVYDIANPYQFKLGNSVGKIKDDVGKLIYDMTQILSLDPCRRFTFGTTIEDCSTRLWFLSHATLLKTKPFDFMRLVHLFLSLAFATPTKMGWDPTITFDHMSNANRRQYKIEVNGKSYTTLQILSDIAADSPLGRATRVWKVEDDDEGNFHVLKDVWLDHSRTEEHLIREEILKAVEGLEDGKRFAEQLKKYMLTPIAYGKVRVDGLPDDTTDVMLAGYLPVEDEMVPLKPPVTVPSRNTRQSTGMSLPSDRDAISSPGVKADESVEPSSEMPLPRRAFLDGPLKEGGNMLRHHRRYHYRVVFKEYATTLYEEKSCDNIFHAIADVVKALWIIHKAGWVHRDISGGNVYWYQKEQVGLIGDFEYARAITGGAHHDVRTGTPFFMAAETLAQMYQFDDEQLSDTDEEDSPPDFGDTWAHKQPVWDPIAPAQVSGNTVAFYHNPLHDLESVWWIIIYLFFFNDDEGSHSDDSDARQCQMERLFNGELENLARFMFLKEPDGLDKARRYLSDSFESAFDLLDKLRKILKSAYRKFESTKTFPNKINNPHFFIHKKLLKVVLENSVYIQPLSKITLVPVKTSSKRKGDTQQDDERSSKRSRYAFPHVTYLVLHLADPHNRDCSVSRHPAMQVGSDLVVPIIVHGTARLHVVEG
ncbi:hypothetical protein F5878DRAFT_193879 [Lentinula raphanica]|uniref:Protein kinase domain-containing protein n=1 Tax=Lentinula raphanica TaxID=153919 RepID=A0AA38PJG1_9AGAR|nr:hypothetical protein F5878DRAFT_193879 [Lentinula raphanica]